MEEQTYVTGYFNPNKFPISLNSPKIGVSTVLAPSAFVIDRQRVKINDPALEQFVGPGRLSRETSKVAVPIRRIGTAAGAPPPRSNPVTPMPPSPKIVDQDRRPNATTPISRGPGHAVITGGSRVVNPDVTAAGRPVVMGMSIAEAEAKGYLGRARPERDNLDRRSVIGTSAPATRTQNSPTAAPTTAPARSQASEFDALQNPQPDPDLAALDAATIMPPAPIKRQPAAPVVPQSAPTAAAPVLESASVGLPEPDLGKVDIQETAEAVPAAHAPAGVPTTYANMAQGTPVVVTAGSKQVVGQFIAYSTKYGMPEVMVNGRKMVRKILRTATEEDMQAARDASAPSNPRPV